MGIRAAKKLLTAFGPHALSGSEEQIDTYTHISARIVCLFLLSAALWSPPQTSCRVCSWARDDITHRQSSTPQPSVSSGSNWFHRARLFSCLHSRIFFTAQSYLVFLLRLVSSRRPYAYVTLFHVQPYT